MGIPILFTVSAMWGQISPFPNTLEALRHLDPCLLAHQIRRFLTTVGVYKLYLLSWLLTASGDVRKHLTARVTNYYYCCCCCCCSYKASSSTQNHLLVGRPARIAVQTRIYGTVLCPTVRLSVCLSHLSTAAAA